MIGHPIKIAGWNSSWDLPYARLYADKLEEMGYCTKVATMTFNELEGTSVVIYSYRSFTAEEARQLIDGMSRADLTDLVAQPDKKIEGSS